MRTLPEFVGCAVRTLPLPKRGEFEQEKKQKTAISRSDFSDFNQGKLLYVAWVQNQNAQSWSTGAYGALYKLNRCAMRTLQTTNFQGFEGLFDHS